MAGRSSDPKPLSSIGVHVVEVTLAAIVGCVIIAEFASMFS